MPIQATHADCESFSPHLKKVYTETFVFNIIDEAEII